MRENQSHLQVSQSKPIHDVAAVTYRNILITKYGICGHAGERKNTKIYHALLNSICSNGRRSCPIYFEELLQILTPQENLYVATIRTSRVYQSVMATSFVSCTLHTIMVHRTLHVTLSNRRQEPCKDLPYSQIERASGSNSSAWSCRANAGHPVM